MRFIFQPRTFLLFALANFCLLNGKGQSLSFDIVIKNISIIDTRHAQILPDRTVFIKDGRIVKIQRSRNCQKPEADTIIEGEGKFISPGFWDMHVHICWKDHLDEALYPTLLSYGVTGLRDMGGDLQLLRALKKKAAAKPAGSPYLVGPGPILDGARPIHADASVPLTIGNIEGVLDSLRKNGADFFKVYSLLPKDVLDSVAFYSHKYNMPFAGHVSEYVEPEEAVALGQRSLEHLNRLEDLGRDTARLLQFIGIANRQQAWFCPTLIIYKRKNEMLNGHFEYNSLYQGLDSSLKAEWEQVKSKMESKEVAKADVASRNERFENQKRLVKTLYNNKVNLLLGTDFAGMQFVYPGYSLHEEMKLLSDIGIANFDILKMGTYNAAAFLGITELYGTVEVNKMADLVIFNKNPIEDITNSTQIDLVIKAGQIVKR